MYMLCLLRFLRWILFLVDTSYYEDFVKCRWCDLTRFIAENLMARMIGSTYCYEGEMLIGGREERATYGRVVYLPCCLHLKFFNRIERHFLGEAAFLRRIGGSGWSRYELGLFHGSKISFPLKNLLVGLEMLCSFREPSIRSDQIT